MAEFYITPNARAYQHIIGTAPFQTFPVSVYAETDWTLFNDPSLIFTIQGESASELNGSGNQSVDIGFTNAINSLDIGFHTFNIRAYSVGEERILPVYLLLTDDVNDFVSPDTMVFSAIKNVEEAATQTIFIMGENIITQIEMPEWLVMGGQSWMGGGQSFELNPILTSMLTESFYSGEVKFHFGSVVKTIFVEYFIKSGYEDSYSKSIHFTRDNDELQFYKTIQENSFLRLDASIKIFGTDGLLQNNFSIPFDLPFINNLAKINLGKELESYIRLFNQPYSQLGRVLAAYPPMEVSITASELKYEDFSVVNQDIIPIQRYLKGRNPVGSGNIDQPFWLAFRPNHLRYVATSASILLQVFKPAGQAIKKINVFLNNVFNRSIDVGQNGFNFGNAYFIYSCFRVSSIPGIKPGDRISFEYEGLSLRRHFVVKTHQPFSFKVAFQTIWETMDIFEFTGPAVFGVEYSHQNSNTIRNFGEVLNKIETQSSQKLTLNTGWIYREEAYLINELNNSKKAFLISDGAQLSTIGTSYVSESYGNIELIPVQQKFTNHETDENLISIDIEFEINKRYEDEIYSR